MTVQSLPRRKHNIHLVFDVPYWAYYNDCISIGKRSPDDILVTASTQYTDVYKLKSDMCMLCYYQQTGAFTQFAEQNGLTTKLVSQYTVGWGHNNNMGLEHVLKYNKTNVIINNFGVWDKNGRKPGTVYIPNGVERGTFQMRAPIDTRPLKIIYIGSKIADKVKNYTKILLPLKSKLESKGIPCDFRCIDNRNPANIMNRTQLAEWYNTASIYVVASSCEGTPNPALESSSCGCTVVSTRVGNMPELITDGYNGYLCDCSVDSLYEGCIKAVDNRKTLQTNMQNEIEKWDWKHSAKIYYDYFRKVLENN